MVEQTPKDQKRDQAPRDQKREQKPAKKEGSSNSGTIPNSFRIRDGSAC